MGFSDRDYAGPGASRGVRPIGSAPNSIVKFLIIANGVIFLIDHLAGRHITGLFAIVPVPGALWQAWRFVTYMFCHGSLWHILMNMYCLYVFGRMVERKVGPSTFIKLYFVSGLIGGISWTLFNWGGFPLVGASGAVFGVMAACALLYPNDYLQLLIPPMPIRVRTFVIVIAIFEVVMLLGEAEGNKIAHLAHLGGLFAGWYYVRKGIMGGAKKSSSSSGKKRRRKRRVPSDGPQPDLQLVPDDNELDRILDKMSEYGPNSLTREERRILDEHSRRLAR